MNFKKIKASYYFSNLILVPTVVFMIILNADALSVNKPSIEDSNNIDLNKIKKTHNNIQEKEDEKRDLMSHIYFLNQEIKSYSSKRATLEKETLSAENISRQLALKLVDQKSLIDKKRKKLRKKLRLMYMYKNNQGFQFLENLLKSENIDKNFKYLKLYSKKDTEQINDYKVALQKLREKDKELKSQLKKLLNEKKKLAKSESELERSQKKKIKFLKKVKKNISYNKEKLKKLKDTLPDLELEASFFEKKGNLPWPSSGVVFDTYGLKLNKEFQFRIWNKFLKIQTEKKEKIFSIHQGKVIFAGELSGYGQTIIIDHKDHYYSVYSQIENLEVRLHQKVKSNELIGRSSNLKEDKIFGYEFSIRHYSESIDPLKWINQKYVARRETP